jgi:hypothetical protein
MAVCNVPTAGRIASVVLTQAAWHGRIIAMQEASNHCHTSVSNMFFRMHAPCTYAHGRMLQIYCSINNGVRRAWPLGSATDWHTAEHMQLVNSAGMRHGMYHVLMAAFPECS